MRPLADLRILALEQYGAGPFGSVHLADLGAEVIKIEDPGTGGDVGRAVPPYAGGGDSLFFETFNRNKRGLSLDLANPAGRTVFENLVRKSDVVYSNLRGDVPAKMRLRYADLAGVNPRIVCCSLSGFGMTGPRRDQPAYDYVLQGLAGWMDLTGEPGGPPAKTGLSLVDYSGGLVAAIALLAGVHAARRDGVGTDCDVSLFDTAISMLTYPATWHLNAGYQPARTRHSAHPSLVPFQNVEAADGWLVIACAKQKFWVRLADAIGRPDLATDRRFATYAERQRNAAVLLPILEEVFRARTVAGWLAALQSAGVPCAHRSTPSRRRWPTRTPPLGGWSSPPTIPATVRYGRSPHRYVWVPPRPGTGGRPGRARTIGTWYATCSATTRRRSPGSAPPAPSAPGLDALIMVYLGESPSVSRSHAMINASGGGFWARASGAPFPGRRVKEE